MSCYRELLSTKEAPMPTVVVGEDFAEEVPSMLGPEG